MDRDLAANDLVAVREQAAFAVVREQARDYAQHAKALLDEETAIPGFSYPVTDVFADLLA